VALVFDFALPDLLVRMSLALGIGLVIGLERGWRQRDERAGARAAGIRTFAITALLGGLIGALARALAMTSPMAAALIVAAGIVAYAYAIVKFSRDENRAEGTFSATTAIAGMATFALGIYAIVGDMRVAAAVAVAIALLLALRQRLHGLLEQITWAELRAALVLAAMTFVAMPFLPAGPVVALGGLDLRQIWLIAIVLAAVSFAGYVAVRYFGTRRGLLVSAIAGGIVSSTAVALSHARRAAAGEAAPAPLAGGLSMASAVSYLRTLVIAGLLNPDPALLGALAPPLVVAILIAGAAGWWLISHGPHEGRRAALALRNPFGFWSVIGFAILLGGASLAGRLVAKTLGGGAILAGAVLIGFADVDPVTVSIANLAPHRLAGDLAALAILGAVASNAVAKAALAIALGGGRFGWLVALMTGASLAGAGLTVLIGRLGTIL